MSSSSSAAEGARRASSASSPTVSPALHVSRSGRPPDAGGSTFVLLHGFGASSFSWRRWVPSLEQRGHVLQIDLLGCGSSARPPHGPYAPDEQADLVLEALAREEVTRPTLVGHSLGGGVALLAALELCDRDRPPARLVIIGGAAYPQPLPPFVTLAGYPPLWRLGLRDPWVAILVAQVLRSIVIDPSVVTPELVEGYAAPLRRPGSADALVASARHIVPADIRALTTRYKGLSVPTLLLWGRQDRVVPLWVGERLARELPHATLRVIERCGHLPHEEHPDRTLALVGAFLDG